MAVRILGVDDDVPIAAFLEDMLSAKGFAVTVASNGPAALELIRKQKPDLVVLDVMMPGMSGFDVCRAIKADPATRDVKVIMATALDQLSYVEKAFSAGACDYVIKPIDNQRLLKKIELALAPRPK